MKTFWILMGAFALCASLGAQGEIYRWTDKNGKVNYSDAQPLDADAQSRRLYDSHIEQDKISFEARKASERFPVVLVTGADCKEPCALARDYLSKHKIPYTEKLLVMQSDIDTLKKQFGKQEFLSPTLLIGSRLLEGFEAGRWTSELDAAGYPK
jgi:hypothetical protein